MTTCGAKKFYKTMRLLGMLKNKCVVMVEHTQLSVPHAHNR